MTKQYSLIYLDTFVYAVDKEKNLTRFKQGEDIGWIIYPNSGKVEKCNDAWLTGYNGWGHPIVASTNSSLGLPLLPEIEDSFDLKVIKLMKQVFVKGQEFQLAAIFRDEEKRITLSNPHPTRVEINMEECGSVNYGFGFPIDNTYYKPKVDTNNIVEIVNWIYE